MIATDEEARAAILRHHEEPLEGVRSRVVALAGPSTGAGTWDAARSELVAYLASEVLTHAAAEETTLYLAASREGLGSRIEEMIAEHRRLGETVADLARTGDQAEAMRLARGFQTTFSLHVAAENDVVLPALFESPDVSLAEVLGGMQQAYSAARSPRPEPSSRAEVEAQLAAALTDSLVALVEAGQADRACRLAAGTWASVREEDPLLAARLTALLHHLARLGAGREPTLPSVPPPGADGLAELDVRDLAPAERHQVIFTTYAALPPAAGFVLVNDHDPRPLRYQLAAEHPGQFTWDYLESGPRVWRVRIGRPASAAA